MSRATRVYAAVLLLLLITIESGGNFLLRILSGQEPAAEHPISFALFRAGHGHAGVLTLLALVSMLYVDHAVLSNRLRHLNRVLFTVAPLLVSVGFFASGGALVEGRPGAGIVVTYVGAVVLAVALILLAVGLLRRSPVSAGP